MAATPAATVHRAAEGGTSVPSGQRRPPHAKAHAPCPYGQTNWSDCDAAHAHRFGPCKAVVGDREPEPCSRWATDETGWCSQHYVALMDKERAKAREAERKLQLDAAIDTYLREQGQEPHVCEPGNCPFSHRAKSHVCDPECSYHPEAIARGEERRRRAAEAEKMMAGGAGLEPAITRVTTEGPTTERPAKGPYRLPERKAPFRLRPEDVTTA